MKEIPEKLLKPYNPEETEPRIYKEWEDSGFFNPDVCVENAVTDKNAPHFSIMLPPPNVTGILHMGHALGISLQDIFVRFKRMRGFKTLWIPGTDHAAIATQAKVEKDIQKNEGKSRADIGREELLSRINDFAFRSHETIVEQLRIIGASVDWSREAFTLDSKLSLGVRTLFKKMYDEELIYRGHRIVNWDPKGQTTISDDEIVYEERKAMLYTFKYSKDFPIAISTTRLETKVGDTAVAVHPDDPRYKEFIDKEYNVKFCGVWLSIKIIADREVDQAFGTGAVGVTPAHSHIDWSIAERHKLPKKQVINEYAKMMVGEENLLNKKTTEAKEIILEWLKHENLLIEEKEISQNIATAERTGGIIEPLPKLQWFVAVNKRFSHHLVTTTLKDKMKKAVESGKIEIIPDHFNKTYFHWIDNLNDWCISRQIWYGHRIPVWYRGEEVYCDINPPEGEGWAQDEDTLDTWFSSGLWTFSTLGWPEQTKDLETYHPTTLLITAYEILFFWVARMILMTGFALNTIPFEKVLITGIVRDAKGQKFSKSLGNGIDPKDIAKKFGMDAGRMALVCGTTPGIDMRISEDKIKGYKHFANKLWNITRFVLESSKDIEIDPEFNLWTEDDKKFISQREELIATITKEIDEYKVHIAGEKLYHYVWHVFADVILEESKAIFIEGSQEEKTSRKQFLLHTLRKSLIVLHPFMPFVTEELWSVTFRQILPLMVEPWPVNKT